MVQGLTTVPVQHSSRSNILGVAPHSEALCTQSSFLLLHFSQMSDLHHALKALLAFSFFLFLLSFKDYPLKISSTSRFILAPASQMIQPTYQPDSKTNENRWIWLSLGRRDLSGLCGYLNAETKLQFRSTGAILHNQSLAGFQNKASKLQKITC